MLRKEIRLRLDGCVAGIVAGVIVAAGCETPERKEAPLEPWDGRPNIVLIVADDQGYADVGVYGAVDFATPALDRMAAEGVRFTDFYAGSNVCTPSRGALMTGSYPTRAGFPSGGSANVFTPEDVVGIHPDEITLAELLKGAGYTTLHIGKWHLGHLPPFLPTRHGFDYFFGVPYSNDMTPFWIMENETPLEESPDQTQLINRYTLKALELLETHHTEHFFLYLAHTMPHFPVTSSAEFQGTSSYGPYGDCMEELDWSTRMILEKLQALGIDERTLVLYTSDNGGNVARGDQLLGRNTPLRGQKGQPWEGGFRVPLIMRWPGRLREGSVITEMAGFIDLYPTLAALGGAILPGDRVIDGVDIWPVIASGAATPREHFFYSRAAGAVRDRQWKLVNGELYDLLADIGETTNQATAHPEIVSALQQTYDTFQAALAAHQRPIGHIDDFTEAEQQPRE